MPRVPSLLALLIISACMVMHDAWAADRLFVVIAAADAVERHLSRETVSQIFSRKQNHWENGMHIEPVNLPATHPLRRAFSQAMLGHLPEEMEDYWREMYFHGVLPPHVLASEEAVILFVASTPGAIGYVSTCSPDRRVTVVLAFGDAPHCPK